MIQWIQKQRNKKGFTLIELVVVVAILGILAALAIPRFTGIRDTAAKNATLADGRTIYSAMEVYYAEKGSYPVDGGAEPTFADPANIEVNGKITAYEIDAEDATIYTMTYTNKEKTYEVTITQEGVTDPVPPTVVTP
jgi:prepilin-type N-terminal cleavage/methylation domain-containing protein